jgi:ABC-type multidrug transport system, ATPase and permease components
VRYKRFLHYLKAYKKYIMLAFFFMLFDVLGEIVQPILMSRIVDVGIANKNLPYIFKVGGFMLIMGLIAVAGGTANVYFAAKTGVNFAADLRKELFHKIQQFSFSNIDEFSTASLVTRLTNDMNLIQLLVVVAVRLLFRSPLLLIFGIIMATSINRSLAMVFLIAVPILGYAIFTVLSKAFPLFKIMQKKLDRVNGNIQENLINVRVVKSFVRQDFEKKKFAAASEELKDIAEKAVHIVVMNMPIMTLVMNLSIIALVWLGGGKVMHGSMQVGELMSFISYVTQILFSLMLLSFVIILAGRASASADRVIEVLETDIDIVDKPDAVDTTVKDGIVEFRNVSFRYNNSDNDVLRNISFKAQKGQVVAIVGATGSAKTSMVQLIPRLYDVSEGQVLIDGVDVRDYKIKNLRQAIGFVLQNNVLFSGTIKENLKWGNTEASDEEVEKVARYAQAHEFVSGFPEKYETELGQGGVNVSGGQKQRLSIARALLKKPKILVLDDSTSAVDTETEAKITAAFHEELNDTTTFIIAQRISSVRYADKIIVLDRGEIVGEGTHDELMKTNKEYQEIYNSQQQTKEVSA